MGAPPRASMEILGAGAIVVSGRPWLHPNGVIPSTLHQQIKFREKDLLVVVLADQETVLPVIPVSSDSIQVIVTPPDLEGTNFHNFQFETVSYIPEVHFPLSSSNPNQMLTNLLRRWQYSLGTGLGRMNQGRPEPVKIKANKGRQGLGYQPERDWRLLTGDIFTPAFPVFVNAGFVNAERLPPQVHSNVPTMPRACRVHKKPEPDVGDAIERMTNLFLEDQGLAPDMEEARIAIVKGKFPSLDWREVSTLTQEPRPGAESSPSISISNDSDDIPAMAATIDRDRGNPSPITEVDDATPAIPNWYALPMAQEETLESPKKKPN